MLAENNDQTPSTHQDRYGDRTARSPFEGDTRDEAYIGTSARLSAVFHAAA